MFSSVALAVVLHATSASLQTDAYVGIAGSAEILPTALLARIGAGVRGTHLGVGAFFERFVAHWGTLDEGCLASGARSGGCLYNPMALGGELTLTPYRWRHVEPFVFAAGGWARREVYMHGTDRRDDVVLGGGVGVNALWLPFTLGLQARYLRYVTYNPSCCGNTFGIMIGLNAGARFDFP